MLRGFAGLAGLGENRYIGRNFWFSYDRVLRVGPSGPALFYYPNERDADDGAEPVMGPQSNAIQAKQPS
jgi:hypothetical protein